MTSLSLQLNQRGPQGPPGPAGGTETHVAAQSISGHIAVSTNDAGQIVPTDRTSLTSAQRCIGITLGAVLNKTTLGFVGAVTAKPALVVS